MNEGDRDNSDIPFRCGYVALIGRPNAGKSTLLNRLLGSKLAITSAKPQTTRNRIAGIASDDDTQAILVDTPGIHHARTHINKEMVRIANEAIGEVDVALLIVDMTVLGRKAERDQPILDALDDEIASALQEAGKPIVLVANKVDVVPHPLVLPVIEAWNARLPFAAAVPLSALTGDGIEPLMVEVRRLLPEQPALFPVEMWTEVTERFLVAEIIREKLFHLTEQEIPYSACIEIRQFDEEERDSQSLVRIYADVIVERPSQKGIVIGKGGEMLKRIGTLARKEIQGLLGCRVYLELFVKVERNWTKSSRGLRRVGFKS